MTLRIPGIAERPPPVTLLVDDESITAYPGESLAAALLAAGITTLRSSPRAKQPRGAFCFMGLCQECLVRVDGQTVLACQTLIERGMVVSTGADLES